MTVEQIKAIQWPTTGFACQVSLKGVYFQSNSYGPMLEVDMLMVKPEDEVCPFGGMILNSLDYKCQSLGMQTQCQQREEEQRF